MSQAAATEPDAAADPWRPRFHYTARRHWINDPNGLVWFEGEYHLFYQHNPFGNEWGHMSWGHAVSSDLVHWQELPVAIPEDERVSIFSGSVVVDTHNSSGFGDGHAPPLVAIYTGCLRRPEGGQAQELAWSHDRGRTWTQYPGNPVLDLGLRDFRDPKVFWHEGTARWVMAVVLPERHTVCFYASTDLKAWAHLSDFARPAPGHGIWECPDLIELPVEGGAAGERVWMLKVDVLEGHPAQGSGARIFFGRFDGTQFIAEPETGPRWADHGADFYAALSWANLPPGHPPTWIAWMNCHRYAKLIPTEPWRGAMTVPRELSARRGLQGEWQLVQRPVRGLQGLRGEPTVIERLELSDGTHELLPAQAERAFEVECECETTPEGSAAGAREFGLLLQGEAGDETRVGFDVRRQTVFVDRSRAGWGPEDPLFAGRHEVAVGPLSSDSTLRMRVLVDACSVEVFASTGRRGEGGGEGTVTLTDQVFPRGRRSVRLFSAGGVTVFSAVGGWRLGG